jgi:hypothetical protein
MMLCRSAYDNSIVAAHNLIYLQSSWLFIVSRNTRVQLVNQGMLLSLTKHSQFIPWQHQIRRRMTYLRYHAA